MAWISAEQCRAARALLLWSQSELAARANVAKQTIQHFEIGKRQPYKRTLDDIVEALTLAGVEFIEPVPGKHVGGVALRWGFDPARPGAGTSTAKGEGEAPGGAMANSPPRGTKATGRAKASPWRTSGTPPRST